MWLLVVVVLVAGALLRLFDRASNIQCVPWHMNLNLSIPLANYNNYTPNTLTSANVQNRFKCRSHSTSITRCTYSATNKFEMANNALAADAAAAAAAAETAEEDVQLQIFKKRWFFTININKFIHK